MSNERAAKEVTITFNDGSSMSLEGVGAERWHSALGKAADMPRESWTAKRPPTTSRPPIPRPAPRASTPPRIASEDDDDLPPTPRTIPPPPSVPLRMSSPTASTPPSSFAPPGLYSAAVNGSRPFARPVPIDTPFARRRAALATRIFIAVDEWLGIALLTYLRAAHDTAFWRVFIPWFIATYVISYPAYWARYDRWWERVVAFLRRR